MEQELKAKDVIYRILKDKAMTPSAESASCFSPINIALIKYWGKRNVELKLPTTSSLSYLIPNIGTNTAITVSNSFKVTLNKQELDNNSDFAKRLISYVKLFPIKTALTINTKNNMPTGGGMASSASGFAAILLAMNQLFAWNLTEKQLSILARIGSGSSARSVIKPGFAIWNKGIEIDGMDSYAEAFEYNLSDIMISPYICDRSEKTVSSSYGMQKSMQSDFYGQWIENSQLDLEDIKQTIKDDDFKNFGRIAQSNSIAMHNICSSVGICYSNDATFRAMEKVIKLQNNGIDIFFTQDAGANLFLIYRISEEEKIKELMYNG